MIAHDFPPEGSAGVYRPLRFVRCLPQVGWRAAVVSCEKAVYERYDPALLALIPPETEVYRARGRDPWQSLQALRARRIQEAAARGPAAIRQRRQAAYETAARASLRQLVRRVESWCYHPDLAMAWIRPAVDEAVKLCVRMRADVICGTAGPVSAFVVAHRASRRTRLPYVLDFRDAWTITYNDFEAMRPAWARRRDRLKLREMLRGAAAVVFRYHSEAECYWRAYAGALHASRVHIIPNGYDGPLDDSPVPPGDKCAILYTGTLSSYRYDTVLQSLRTFKQRDPEGAGRLSLVFVGEGSEALRREAESCGVGDMVETRGPVSHDEVTKLQRNAHALLALGRPSSMKGYELFAGAKIFEYLKARKPIIGFLPQDETRNILSRVKVSTVADIESPSAMIGVLEALMEAWASSGLNALLPDRAACEAYSAEQQTAALARALEGAPAMQPFIPGAVEIPASLREDIDCGEWIRNDSQADAEPIGAAP